MHTETALQIACVEWFRYQYPQYVIYMNCNDGLKTKRQGQLDKARGLGPGIPDLFIAQSSKGYHGLYIELKTSKGQLTEKQVDMAIRLTEAGYLVVTARSIDRFMDIVNEYLNE